MTRIVSGLAIAALAFVLVSAGVADAGGYPINRCVSTKQKAASKLCSSVFKAWSTWEKKGANAAADTKRDEAIAKALLKFDGAYAGADEKSLDAGRDCSESGSDGATVSGSLISAIDVLATSLDGGAGGDAKCASGLLKELGKLCGGIIKADAKHISNPNKDEIRERLVSGKARTRTKYDGKAAGFESCAAGSPRTASDFGDDTVAIADAAVALTIISDALPIGEWTQVDPPEGGQFEYDGKFWTAQCQDGSPWTMWARRGTVNKVVFYYQGGGACFDYLSCQAEVCAQDVDPVDDHPDTFQTGLGDLNDPNNPVKDWHAVYIPYCTCDIHWGSKNTNYTFGNGPPPRLVRHFGFHNARFAEQYAREHFLLPEEVVVTGSSAGAYGALANAAFLHEVFGSTRFNVIADGGAGVVDQDFIAENIPNWGVLSTLPRHIPALDVPTLDGLSLANLIVEMAKFYEPRGSRFATYTTSHDWNQGFFFNVMIEPDPINWLNWRRNICEWNSQMNALQQSMIAGSPTNTRYYVGPGTDHTVYGHPKVYTETNPGEGGIGTITLLDWITDINGETPGPSWVNSDCEDSTCQHTCADFAVFNFTCAQSGSQPACSGGDSGRHQDDSCASIPDCAQTCGDAFLCDDASVCFTGPNKGAEACDDGNNIDGDGCQADCSLP